MKLPFLGRKVHVKSTSAPSADALKAHKTRVVVSDRKAGPSIGFFNKYRPAAFMFAFGIIGASTVLFSSAAVLIEPPKDLAATDVTRTHVGLTWQPSTTPGIKEYQISRNGLTIARLPADRTGYSDDRLKRNTKYGYQVRAVDRESRLSDYTEILTVTTLD